MDLLGKSFWNGSVRGELLVVEVVERIAGLVGRPSAQEAGRKTFALETLISEWSRPPWMNFWIIAASR